MKKVWFFSICLILSLTGLIIVLPEIKTFTEYPENLIVTTEDIKSINENNIITKLDLPKNLVVSNDELTSTKIELKLFNIIPIRTLNVRLLNKNEVFLGGEAVGFNLYSEGVICVGSNPIISPNGSVEPFKDSGLKEGDAILKIENISISNIDDIDRIINLPIFEGKQLNLTIRRNNEEFNTTITPAFDLLSNKYKLGLWIRNFSSGVGTLTYVKTDNFRFGSVGHPIIDQSLGNNFNVEKGNIYKCKILGVKKGEKNDPGEIKSSINLSDDAIGIADTNCKYGVYGNILNKSIINAEKTINLSGRMGVSLGDAQIYCSIDNEGVKAYDIKILKANKQNNADDKSMIIKVTDKELLEKTGGIIQGMSGSPIVQNGKIIGAVTHVMLNDPTRGYGVYIDWMIDN